MSSRLSVPRALTQPFLDAGGQLVDALLVLDAGAAEACHCNLGLKALQGTLRHFAKLRSRNSQRWSRGAANK